jgi:hypothetical protein
MVKVRPAQSWTVVLMGFAMLAVKESWLAHAYMPTELARGTRVISPSEEAC